MGPLKCTCYCATCLDTTCLLQICDDSCLQQDVPDAGPETQVDVASDVPAVPDGKCTAEVPCKDGGAFCLVPGGWGGCGMCMKPGPDRVARQCTRPRARALALSGRRGSARSKNP